MADELSRNERLKEASAYLRGSVAEGLRDEVTGFLIFDQSWFFQILEGERARVLSTYERIQKDPRHGDVTLMSMRDVRERSASTEVLGLELDAPILLAPIGVQRIVHPEGELASARAAASLGVPIVLSTSSSSS